MIRELAQGIDGIITIAVKAPGQALRTFAMLPPADRKAILARAGLGDDMSQNYYFGNPQLFKMPAHFREPSPPLTQSPVTLGYSDSSVNKALPYIVGGIALIVAYNMFFKKGR